MHDKNQWIVICTEICMTETKNYMESHLYIDVNDRTKNDMDSHSYRDVYEENQK